MNRDIKFRAWDTVNLRYNEHGVFVDCEGVVFSDTDPHGVDMSGKRKILATNKYVIQLFIGLKENAYDQDEYNNEIYDGDIIEFINGERLSVEWNDDTCQWQYSDGSPINSGDRYSTYKKILGNIYENPDLLK